MEVKFELKDKTPFYIRPFPIKEEEKIIVDRRNEKRLFTWDFEKKLE